MAKHNMSLTYTKKIDPVRRNEIKQTIRTMRIKRINPGDELSFHGWFGKPYRSDWNSKKRVVVKSVCYILISANGICVDDVLYSWDSPQVNMLARLDGIIPATGKELKNVLFGLNGTPTMAVEYQVIRW